MEKKQLKKKVKKVYWFLNAYGESGRDCTNINTCGLIQKGIYMKKAIKKKNKKCSRYCLAYQNEGGGCDNGTCGLI